MGIDNVVAKEIALGIQAHNLAAGTEAGVNCHDALLADRRCQKKLPQILPKHLHGLFIGLFFGLIDDFRGY